MGTTARAARALGKQVLALLAQTWARVMNHRPRADRGGLSRAQLYGQLATAEQIDSARAALEPLVRARDAARVEVHDLAERVRRFVDLALAAIPRVDRLFWLLAVADEINAVAASAKAALVDVAARRIHATHRVPRRDRQEAVLVIIGHVVPLR